MDSSQTPPTQTPTATQLLPPLWQQLNPTQKLALAQQLATLLARFLPTVPLKPPAENEL